MISEKTVELNLTTELLNWLFGITRRTHYVIAPSQREEGRLGFDASFQGPGPALFIQFKRAYVNGFTLTWKLNRTADEDQHLRLQDLESAGANVFYAFPLFFEPGHVASGRRGLLLQTLWVRPSKLRPSGGPIGPHDLILDRRTGQLTLASPDPIRLEALSSGLEEVAEVFRRSDDEEVLSRYIAMANQVLFTARESSGLGQGVMADHAMAVGLALVGTETLP